MSELAVYGIARDVAKDESSKSGQKGTPVFGFTEDADGYEVVTGDPMELAEYNLDFNIVVPKGEFNLIVRKENPDALKALPKDRLRRMLSQLLDSI